MPRLFAGLELPEAVARRLALVAGPLPGTRWIAPEDLHLTLRFAGDVDNAVARELDAELGRIETSAFELHVKGLGVFGGREPRTLWAGFAPSDPLMHLQRACERACRNVGLPPDPRAFEPHVTLARLKGTRPEVLARFLGDRGGLDVTPFRVTRLVLFNARTSVGGGPYGITATFPFAGEFDEDDLEAMHDDSGDEESRHGGGRER